jgi:hypothetical protein
MRRTAGCNSVREYYRRALLAQLRDNDLLETPKTEVQAFFDFYLNATERMQNQIIKDFEQADKDMTHTIMAHVDRVRSRAAAAAAGARTRRAAAVIEACNQDPVVLAWSAAVDAELDRVQ